MTGHWDLPKDILLKKVENDKKTKRRLTYLIKFANLFKQLIKEK